MIDFACKQFKLEEVIKCGLGLTKADMKVFLHYTKKSVEWLSSEKVASELKLNLSTVQRAVKKLHEQGVLERRQHNLEGGGYIFYYEIKSKPKVRKVIMDTIQRWVAKVDSELNKW